MVCSIFVFAATYYIEYNFITKLLLLLLLMSDFDTDERNEITGCKLMTKANEYSFDEQLTYSNIQ